MEQTVRILRDEMEDPPALNELARRVGCSPFHLSRIFKKETGLTISRFVRKERIDTAAELLASGEYNVTEAAMEVGYNSMSHFSVAFCEEKGVCPALFVKSRKA